jgi:hypothetical protein
MQSATAVGVNRGTTKWQERLLPLMVSMLVGLSLFFCVALVLEGVRIQRHIEEAHEIDPRPTLEKTISPDQARNFDDRMELAQLQTMAVLESNAMESRYHQATMALLIRISIVFLGFLTGMVLSLVGAAFILGKLREPSSNMNAEAGGWKVSLTTVSPGLVLVLLGTTLMLATITARIDVNVTDAALYLSSDNLNARRSATIQTAPGGSTTQPSARPEKRSDVLKEIDSGKPK